MPTQKKINVTKRLEKIIQKRLLSLYMRLIEVASSKVRFNCIIDIVKKEASIRRKIKLDLPL